MTTHLPPPPPVYGSGGQLLPPCPIPSPAPPLPPPAPRPVPLGAPLIHERELPPDQPTPEPGRDERGRFTYGNPGRRPGTRCRVTVASEKMMEGQWETLTKTAINMALRGDPVALKLCMDRLVPVRRGSTVEIPDFPKLESVADVPKANAALVAAVTAGYLTADEAAPINSLLAAYVGSVEAVTLSERMAELERRLDGQR